MAFRAMPLRPHVQPPRLRPATIEGNRGTAGETGSPMESPAVHRRIEHRIRVADLDHAAPPDAEVVPHHPQIVRHQQHRQPEPLLQVQQHIQYLRLHRYVIPAQSGNPCGTAAPRALPWMPASAGMTMASRSYRRSVSTPAIRRSAGSIRRGRGGHKAGTRPAGARRRERTPIDPPRLRTPSAIRVGGQPADQRLVSL